MGGLGAGALGFLAKSGGAAEAPGVIGELGGVDIKSDPMHTLRTANELGDQAQWANGTAQENMDYLAGQGLSEYPRLNQKVRKGWDNYTGIMEGENDAGWKDLNSLFNPNDEPKNGLDVRQLTEGGESNLKNLDVGQQAGIIKQAGFADAPDLAASVKYPRLVNIADSAGAEFMNNTLKEGGLKFLSDDTWLGHNTAGEAVFAKRIGQAAQDLEHPEAGVGPHKIRIGDQFLMGVTDNAKRLVPSAENFADRNIQDFAKMQRWAQQGVQHDVFSHVDDQRILASQIAQQELDRGGTKASIMQRAGQRLTQALGGSESGLLGEQASALIRNTLDTISPTLAKLPGNKLYSTLYQLAKGRNEVLNRILSETLNGKITGYEGGLLKKPIYSDMGRYGNRSVRAIIDELSPEERHSLAVAGNARVGVEQLGDVIPENMITPKLVQAMTELKKIDDDFFKNDFLPSFKGDQQTLEKFKIDPNFTTAHMGEGIFQAPIFGEDGKQIWNVVGKSRKEVQDTMDQILKEAEFQGKDWKGGKVGTTLKQAPDDVQQLQERLSAQLARPQNVDALKVIRQGMKQQQANMWKEEIGGPRVKSGGALSAPGVKKFVAGNPTYTAADIMKAYSQHRRGLLSYAADYGYRERFHGPMMALQKLNPTLYGDMQRKLSQFAGLAGPYTRAIDQSLSKVLGPTLGGRAGSTIARVTNNAMYLWNLGIWNPTNAVVNILTPLTVLPGMVARIQHMTPEVFQDLMFVAPKLTTDGKVVGMHSWLDPMKVTLKAFRDAANPSPERLQTIARAAEEGSLTAGTTDEWVGPNSKYGASMKEIYDHQGAWPAIVHGLTYMSEKTEEFSRLIALNAGANIAEAMGLEGEAAHTAAVQMMEMGAYGYKQTQRSRIITGPVGSVFGLFKNFQIHYINDMLSYIGMGMRGESWSPFLWQQATTLALGGLGSTPLIHLADGLASWHDNAPNSYAWMQHNWANLQDKAGNNAAADGMYFGLPGLLHFSLQSSLQQPGTDVGNDLSTFGNVVAWERATTLAQAVGASYDYFKGTGNNPLDNEFIRSQLLNATMPRAAIRAMSVVQGDFVKQMKTGYVSQRDVPVGDRVLYGLGITPTPIAAHMMEQQELWKDEQARRAAIQATGLRIANAMLEQNVDEMTKATHDAMIQGVDLGAAFKSARTVYNREMVGTNVSRYKPQDVAAYAGQY
jgi:hypothetical protein